MAAATGAQAGSLAPLQRSAKKDALRGMDFAAGEAALSPNGALQMKEEGGGDDQEPTEDPGPKSVKNHAMIVPAGKLQQVKVTGYGQENVKFRETAGSRVIIECVNRITGQIGQKTIETVEGMLGALVDDQSATDGTMTISRDDGKIRAIKNQFGDSANVEQIVTVFVPKGVATKIE